MLIVEDIANQSRVVFEAVYSMTEKTQFLGVHVSPGSAET